MADREKVIELLQETAEYFRECRSNASFASKAENHFWELQNAANEAVELLKEQEPVEPRKEDDGNQGPCTCWWYVCGSCGRDIDPQDRFCRHCGRAVKWK